MREQSARRGGEIARIAARQHGVVTFAQLLSAGLDKNAVGRHVAEGRLHRVHRGVYAVGHRALSQEGWWMAAVLACGPEAALSHGSAAALWGLLRPISGPIDVSVSSTAGRKRRAGIRVHRSRSLGAAPKLIVVRNRIPVTNVARTVADLKGTVAPYLLRRAIRQAELAKLPLGPAVQTDGTRSDLERDFLDLCREHRLPAPEVNVKVGRWRIDFLWRPQRLAVETDFYAYHRGSVAFEDDHERDFGLRRMGYAVHRYTGAQLRSYPAEIAAELGEILSWPFAPRRSQSSRNDRASPPPRVGADGN